MFDDIDKRPCPHCGKAINEAATRCGFCWAAVTPVEAGHGTAAAPNHREAFRLVEQRDCAAIEALLDERDRLREALARQDPAAAMRVGSAPAVDGQSPS